MFSSQKGPEKKRNEKKTFKKGGDCENQERKRGPVW